MPLCPTSHDKGYKEYKDKQKAGVLPEQNGIKQSDKAAVAVHEQKLKDGKVKGK